MSVAKKRRAIDIDWIQDNIITQIPDETVQKIPRLRDAVEQWAKTKDAAPIPSVSKCGGEIC